MPSWEGPHHQSMSLKSLCLVSLWLQAVNFTRAQTGCILFTKYWHTAQVWLVFAEWRLAVTRIDLKGKLRLSRGTDTARASPYMIQWVCMTYLSRIILRHLRDTKMVERSPFPREACPLVGKADAWAASRDKGYAWYKVPGEWWISTWKGRVWVSTEEA